MQTAAVIATLFAFAGILGAMALGVGLYALYRVVADTYGVDAGLGAIAGLLVAAAWGLCAGAAPAQEIIVPAQPVSYEAYSYYDLAGAQP